MVSVIPGPETDYNPKIKANLVTMILGPETDYNPKIQANLVSMIPGPETDCERNAPISRRSLSDVLRATLSTLPNSSMFHFEKQ